MNYPVTFAPYSTGLTQWPVAAMPGHTGPTSSVPGWTPVQGHNPFAPNQGTFLATSYPDASQESDASAEAKETEKPSSTLGKAWKKFVLFAPIVGFIGSTALILGGRSSLINPIRKMIGRVPVEASPGEENMRNVGRKFLGFAIMLKSLGGISAGIVSGQPSMIWGNLIQLVPSGILAFKKSNALQNFATSMEMLLGGFYTVGFANELKNKDPKTKPEQIRRYDMTFLKSLFKRESNLSLGQRATGLLSTAKSMAAFTVEDHILLVKDLKQKFFALRPKKTVAPSPEQPLLDKVDKWAREPSAIKSQVAVLFFYLGTLPILLLTRRNPKIGEKKSIIALKATGMAIANSAPFAIALNRDDLRGQAPLIGAPMAVIGMANSRNPFFVGLGHLGESFSDLFFSDVAVNGVKTKSEPSSKSATS